MRYPCLAYGDENGWNSLSEGEKREVLDQGAMIRDRRNTMSAVRTTVTSARNWNNRLEVADGPYAEHELPLAGFSIIEAESLDEGVDLVANTPCARAMGVIAIRPFWNPRSDDT